MFEILLKVIGLGIASAASPGIIAISISLLSNKEHGVRNLLFFLLGGVLVALLLVAASSEMWGGALTPNSAFTKRSHDFDVALGLIFILVGLTQLLPGQKEIAFHTRDHHPAKLVFLGFLANITNFDAILFNMAALRTIIVPDISAVAEFLLIILAELFFLSPSLVPLAIYLFYPEKTKVLLGPVDSWLQKHGRYVIAGILIMIGVWLLIMG